MIRGFVAAFSSNLKLKIHGPKIEFQRESFQSLSEPVVVLYSQGSIFIKELTKNNQLRVQSGKFVGTDVSNENCSVKYHFWKPYSLIKGPGENFLLIV